MQNLTINDWTNALPHLRKRGNDLIGPCPSCGGRDRFHIKAHGTMPLVGCRGCIDGKPAGVKSESFKRIIELVFGAKHRPESNRLPVREQTARERMQQREVQERAEMGWTWAACESQELLDCAVLKKHPYLADKGFPDRKMFVSTGFPIRHNPWVQYPTGRRPKEWSTDGHLVIPIRSENGSLHSLQLIAPDGKKRFMRGSLVKGGRYEIGERGGTRWVVEGYATMLSVREALAELAARNNRVVMAFSASNIPAIVRRGDRIVADNDPNGVGARYARDTGEVWTMPETTGDANDLHQEGGIEALRDVLRRIL